ncbi:hypothetical protein LINPERPRIM_LOCUS31338 [Linum perenne]
MQRKLLYPHNLHEKNLARWSCFGWVFLFFLTSF